MKPIDPETRRFYALPGMTRANRRKQKLIERIECTTLIDAINAGLTAPLPRGYSKKRSGYSNETEEVSRMDMDDRIVIDDDDEDDFAFE